MSNYDIVRFVLSAVILLVIFLLAIRKKHNKFKIFTVSLVVKSGLFAALSTILYIIPIFNISLPFFPSFLQLHIDEVPALIAGFAYGPLSGVLVILIKTLIKLPLSTSAFVGELADFIYSFSFIFTAALIYKQKKTFKRAVLAMIVGALVHTAVASLLTTYFILDFYMKFFGMSKEVLLSMCQAVNPKITSLGPTFLFFVAIPFNAFKNIVVIILTLILYKKSHSFLDKVGQ